MVASVRPGHLSPVICENGKEPTTPPVRARPLSLPGLVAIIYYSVAGGPFGTEDIVAAAGPLLALLGFVVMPLVWSAPEALVAAELATAFPSNAGYVTWVTAAFGPFWGFQEGFMSWLCGVSDNAIYPVLFCDYLKHVWPASGEGTTKQVCVLTFILALSWLNYRGLNLVGLSAVFLAVFTILPFLYIVPAGLPQVEVQNLLIVPEFGEIHWRKYMNVLFWNLNYWDSASTLAGEVHEPRVIFPQALLFSGVLILASYLLPLFVGVGLGGKGGGPDWRSWHSGSLALLGEKTGGFFVKSWVVAASGVSSVGQFACEQAANAYQLQGMAEWGWLPKCVGRRSSYGTPMVGFAIGLVWILLLATQQEFLSIVSLLNGLYCQSQLLEFAAFLRLRSHHRNLWRPFRVPLKSTWSCFFMLLGPIIFAIMILLMPVFAGDWLQVGCFIAAPMLGALVYALLGLCRRRQWLEFVREPPRNLEEVLALQTPMSTFAKPLDGDEAILEPLLLPPAAII